MIEYHLTKLRARDDISVEEEQAIRAAVAGCEDVPADRTIIRPNVELKHSTLLLDGILCRYKDGRNGERQITELHLPGDFVDLHSFTLKRLDHSVMSLTPSRIATVPHDNIRHITEHYPHLTRVYWFATNLDAAIHREWVFSLGCRDAQARIAALFCELLARFQVVGLANDQSYDLPLTQADLGDCTGLTSVHVNRTLKMLREGGLATFRNGRVEIHDLPGLRRAGEFDPGYLYLDRRRH